jgi:hypothetical protein
LVILNSILFILLILLGLFIDYFYGINHDEFLEFGLLRKILAVYCRLSPVIIKIIHYIKFMIVILAGFFAFIKNDLSLPLLNDTAVNWTAYDITCQNKTATDISISNYKSKVLIFEIIELFSIFLVLCVLGVVKNLIRTEGFIYEPQNLSHGKLRTILMRNFGP